MQCIRPKTQKARNLSRQLVLVSAEHTSTLPLEEAKKGKQRKGGGEWKGGEGDVANSPSATTLKQGKGERERRNRDSDARFHTPLAPEFRNGNLSVLGSLSIDVACVVLPVLEFERGMFVCSAPANFLTFRHLCAPFKLHNRNKSVPHNCASTCAGMRTKTKVPHTRPSTKTM